jgi:predicted secreted protein
MSVGMARRVDAPEMVRLGALLPLVVEIFSKIRIELEPELETKRRLEVASSSKRDGEESKVAAPLIVALGATFPLMLKAELKCWIAAEVDT